MRSFELLGSEILHLQGNEHEKIWFDCKNFRASAFLERPYRTRKRERRPPRNKREAAQVDAVLEKIAKRGLDSLTAEERALLEEVSGKYRRRAESKKPESGLAI